MFRKKNDLASVAQHQREAQQLYLEAVKKYDVIRNLLVERATAPNNKVLIQALLKDIETAKRNLNIYGTLKRELETQYAMIQRAEILTKAGCDVKQLRTTSDRYQDMAEEVEDMAHEAVHNQTADYDDDDIQARLESLGICYLPQLPTPPEPQTHKITPRSPSDQLRELASLEVPTSKLKQTRRKKTQGNN